MTENGDKEILEKLPVIIEALREKKGKEITTINLTKTGTAVCDYFVICHGDSSTQVDALSDSVQKKLKEELKERPHHIEGKENSLWVLMDYSDVLVHIFQKDTRKFYNLEDLWADGEFNTIEED